MRYEYCVIGGGIVGLATARDLLRRRPGASLLLIEKEEDFGQHQTGHNSGVIHAGVYYAPGSLKARLCREGAAMTKAYCTEKGIPFETCGKLIVATNAKEEAGLAALAERCAANGVGVEKIGPAGLRVVEPNIAGTAALLVAETGIVNYQQICRALADDIRRLGGELHIGTQATGIRETGDGVEITTNGATIITDRLIVCGGLQSDRLAKLAGLKLDLRIIPFRGEYFRLPASKSDIVRHLIYPVPDASLPFLGIHLTRMIDGSVTVGPNAVLGLAREGYPKFSFNLRDAFEIATFPGSWRLLKTHWRSALDETRNSLFRSGYLEMCRKYCPSLELSDLEPYPAGIRAQAVMKDGALVHDFLFEDTPRSTHVLNAPSPAATSAMPIGRMIADRVLGETTAAR